MKKPSPRATKVMAATVTPLAVVAAGAMVYQASYAAFTGQTRTSGNDFSTGSVALTDDDNGAARFQVASMKPGDTDTRCIKVTANASVPGKVRGYVVNPIPSGKGLEDRIKMSVAEGDGGSFASCNGFVKTGDVFTSTPMSQLFQANSYATAVGGWDVPAGTSTRTYQITWSFDTSGLTQTQIDQLQGAHTGFDFQWELQSN
ncbi:hypothetical protein GON03_15290 [Nocardioides sp. MAH-18]|uniref:Camelysin metallo-endopeptidase n=1 Tax=Nocardioides agri TaxID=2682843 RepID=A0A6L6XTP1_9ACTN|nr:MULTISPECIES: hypothetical protein [unclassified Nocardioides]MBA2955700.1 hypothetical protein [Nocardioides sp. CGMCC 1.13656]MVQ50550.1 hypothetical protein [Nocardioides sp. MAH-18]